MYDCVYNINILKTTFLTISEDFPKFVRRPHGSCRTFSKNFRRLPKTFRVKHDTSEVIDIFTSENVENRVPDVVPYKFYEWCIYRFNALSECINYLHESTNNEREISIPHEALRVREW